MNIKATEKLFESLGFSNIQIVDRPMFKLDMGDGMVRHIQVGTMLIQTNLVDYLNNHLDKQFVIYQQPDGTIINQNNEIRFFETELTDSVIIMEDDRLVLE